MSIFNLKNYLGGNESNKIYLGDKVITDVQLGGPGPSGDADADAYILAVTTAGGTLSAGEETAIQTLFTETKAAGVYTKLARMYPLAGGVQASHAINALNPGTNNLVFNGTWSHSNATGSRPNGTTNDYANIGVLGVGGDGLIGNNYHHSLYLTAAKTTTNFEYDLGGGSDGATEVILESTSYRYSRISRGDNSQEYQNPPSSTSGFFANSSQDPGFTLMIRTIQTARSFGITWSLPTVDTYLGARLFNGTVDVPATATYGFLTFGTYLDSTELGDFETAINTFQTSFGRNAY
tara:strand:+ start:21 stop:899 length:879 start_codon:yes stop_codon:yes gene_type:complete